MAMDDEEDGEIVVGLARKARGDDKEEKSEPSDKYEGALDSAADELMTAIDDGNRDGIKESLRDFVKACMRKG